MDKKAMEEFEDMLLNAFKDAIKKPEDAEVKDGAMKVATANKALFDAHVKVGFTVEQAIQIVVATNTFNA